MKLAIVIPAYNEESVLEKVLCCLPKKINNLGSIISIVVDDGSTDNTFGVARAHSSYTLKHIINLGVGAATLTGLEFAKNIGADIIMTMDADGQHHSDDIEKLISPIVNNQADVVLGARVFSAADMPIIKIIGNWIMNLITLIVFRKWVSDSQSGMKAFSNKAISKMNLCSKGYEICSEIVGEVKEKKLRMIEIPIKAIYTNYSKIKGQNMLNAVNIFTKILFFKITGRK